MEVSLVFVFAIMSHERKFPFLIAIIRLKTLHWRKLVLKSMETHKSYQQIILKLFVIVLTEIAN